MGSDCLAGYYCLAGANNIRPRGTLAENGWKDYNGDMCEESQYCIVGRSSGTDCPVGTFSNGRGLKTAAECTTCPEGYYCDVTGLTWEEIDTEKLCPAGYYCLAGTDDSNPAGTGAVLPVICSTDNKYCPVGSIEEKECPIGYYSVFDGTNGI